MFVDSPRAVQELIRVCKPGGRLLATESFWCEPPTPEAHEIFLGLVCPGMQVDTYGGVGAPLPRGRTEQRAGRQRSF